MTIKAFRLYFSCRDKEVERRVSLAHWGVSYWTNDSAASYPQLRAIGALLSVPLTPADLDAIQREIDVPRETRLAPAIKKMARLQERAKGPPSCT